MMGMRVANVYFEWGLWTWDVVQLVRRSASHGVPPTRHSRCTRRVAQRVALQAWYIDSNIKALLENMNGTDDKTARKVTFNTGHLSGYTPTRRAIASGYWPGITAGWRPKRQPACNIRDESCSLRFSSAPAGKSNRSME